MKRAAIDIGSNSIRLASSDGETASVITQLAAGIEKSGALSPAGIEKTLDALKSFAAQTRDCSEVYAFATEAVRRAADGESFCKRVKRETGVTVIVLAGEAEAYLALAGFTKPNGPITVCDLGGGSMELVSSADGKKPDYVKSLPLGVVVLKNMFCGDYARATETLPRLMEEYGEVQDYPLVITGGSACAIAAAMLDLDVYDKTKVSTEFSSRDLDDFMPMFLSPKLPVFRPLTAKRADTLPYGALAIRALLCKLGAKKFYVSDASNLEAVLSMPSEAVEKLFL